MRKLRAYGLFHGRLIVLLLFAWTFLGRPARAANSDWMSGHYGLMIHFLPCAANIGEFNQFVNGFNVQAFASDVAQSGAGYVIFTLGQQNYFCAPNSTLNRLCGQVTSDRDLIRDVSDALAARNIKLIVYMPSGAPQCMQAGTQYLAECAADQHCRRSAFQINWQHAISEYSRNWGSRVAGWWFDGCYDWQSMYAFTNGPNFQTFAAAARAGNSVAVVTFNDGFGPYSNHTQYADFAAGEIWDHSQSLIECEGKYVNGVDPATGASFQVLWNLHTFLGHEFVGNGYGGPNDTPRFSDAYIRGFVQRVISKGGTCQLDVPIHPGGWCDPDPSLEGHLSTNFTSQLQSIAGGLSQAPSGTGTNSALRQPATASNTYPGLTPANGNDGNVGTIWASGTDGSSVKWWQVDLGASKAINAVQLVFSQTDNRAFLRQNFQVEASDDPNFGAYDVIGVQTDKCYLQPYSDFYTFATAPVTHRYVRFTRPPADPSTSAGHFQIAEARVYTASNVAGTPMFQGEYLKTGQYLTSPTGQCFLIMQSDGNLVLYSGSGPTDNRGWQWSSLNASQPVGDYFASLQTDGNLCVYKGTGPADNRGFVWGSFTSGMDFLTVSDDRKLTIYRGTSPSDSQGVLWSVP